MLSPTILSINWFFSFILLRCLDGIQRNSHTSIFQTQCFDEFFFIFWAKNERFRISMIKICFVAKTGCEGEWSAFDPLPKLTQASDTDVRIIVGKERESYEPKLNSRIRGRTPRAETSDWYGAERQKQKTGSQCESVLFRNLWLSQFNKPLWRVLFLDVRCFDKVL